MLMRFHNVLIAMLTCLVVMGSPAFAAITMSYPPSSTQTFLWQHGNGTVTPTPTTVTYTVTYVPNGGGTPVALGSNSGSATGGAWQRYISSSALWTNPGVYFCKAYHFDTTTYRTVSITNTPGIL